MNKIVPACFLTPNHCFRTMTNPPTRFFRWRFAAGTTSWNLNPLLFPLKTFVPTLPSPPKGRSMASNYEYDNWCDYPEEPDFHHRLVHKALKTRSRHYHDAHHYQPRDIISAEVSVSRSIINTKPSTS